MSSILRMSHLAALLGSNLRIRAIFSTGEIGFSKVLINAPKSVICSPLSFLLLNLLSECHRLARAARNAILLFPRAAGRTLSYKETAPRSSAWVDSMSYSID